MMSFITEHEKWEPKGLDLTQTMENITSTVMATIIPCVHT